MQCLWRGKTPARSYLKLFLAGMLWRGANNNFSSPGPVSPFQNVQILAKVWQNEQIPCHGETRIKIFHRRGVLAGKNMVFRPAIFSPCPALTFPTKDSLGKKLWALVGSVDLQTIWLRFWNLREAPGQLCWGCRWTVGPLSFQPPAWPPGKRIVQILRQVDISQTITCDYYLLRIE